MSGTAHNYIFLSETFYQTFPHSKYPEIATKTERPYMHLSILIDGQQWAIPLRSNINHSHVIWSNGSAGCGLDLSKAVPITDPSFIDTTTIPHIRDKEYRALKQVHEQQIERKLRRVMRRYLKDKNRSDTYASSLLSYSTFQYFEEHLPES